MDLRVHQSIRQGSLFDAPPAPLVVPDLSLRPYQQAARDAVHVALQLHRGALVVHPTGTGKTEEMIAVCWDYHARGLCVLVLEPTIDLAAQTYRRMRASGLPVGLEQASNYVDRDQMPAVVVASVATMRGARLLSWPAHTFDLVISDEAHRAASAQQRVIYAHFSGAKRLGFTATPCRADGVSLLNVFDTTAHEMTMLKAIEDGWLVPLHFRTALTDFDPKALRKVAGDVSAGSVEAEIMRSGLVHEAANTFAEISGAEPALLFAVTVAVSKAVTAELLARGVPTAHIDGSTPREQREEFFAQFRAGTLRVLSNCAVLIEGIDLPAASVVGLMNPSQNPSKITQMIGRVARRAPGKTRGLVIDFCAGRLRKGRLASPADALAGRMLPDNVHELLEREGDLAKAIEKAVHTADEIEQKKREAAEAALRRKERIAELARLAQRRDFSYRVRDHDARDILGGVGAGDGGITTHNRRLSFAERKEQEAQRRRQLGLCSPNQAYHLRQGGLNPDLPWKLARVALDAYFDNAQTFPQWVLEDPRFQLRRQA